MTDTSNVNLNLRGGHFDSGKPYSPSKWASITSTYREHLAKNGKCSVRDLANVAAVSNGTAAKAIKLVQEGNNVPPVRKKVMEKQDLVY